MMMLVKKYRKYLSKWGLFHKYITSYHFLPLSNSSLICANNFFLKKKENVREVQTSICYILLNAHVNHVSIVHVT